MTIVRVTFAKTRPPHHAGSTYLVDLTEAAAAAAEGALELARGVDLIEPQHPPLTDADHQAFAAFLDSIAPPPAPAEPAPEAPAPAAELAAAPDTLPGADA